MSDKKTLKGIRKDLVAVKRMSKPTYHKLERQKLNPVARQIHKARVSLEKKHPPGCMCPWHGGHK